MRWIHQELPIGCTCWPLEQLVGMCPPESEFAAAPDCPALAEQLARLAIEGDEPACAELLERILRSGIGMVEVYQDILGGTMRHVGEWYHLGAIDVAGEHAASSIVERLMYRASQIFGHGIPTNRTALLGGGPETWHVIGLRMLADVLRNQGWRVIFLGPNMPVPAFLKAVETRKPDLVLLSCHAVRSLDGTLEMIRALGSYRRTLPSGKTFLIGVGGGFVRNHPEYFRDAGADFQSEDLRSFATRTLPEIDRILGEGGHWVQDTFTRPRPSASPAF
ncbi:cobalamin B12-binding domain-containing protein [bacterium]|nr:MAG: cobalamin B12-binding domain-containing protein [bacterium]